jgi:acyl-CoA thioesterase-2
VERTRDGRSFATRHVTAVQEGEAIFTLTASFHGTEEGLDWQVAGPDLTPPHDIGPEPEEFAAGGPPYRAFWSTSPFQLIPVRPDPENFVPHPCWVRLIEPITNDPALQACALTFISDMGVVGSARAPTDRGRPGALASIDHAVWFHRPFDIAQWHLFSVDPVSNSSSRGLALGTLHASDGRRIASIAQEALIRR